MSDTPQGPGWWMASDYRYYPPPAPGPAPAPVASAVPSAPSAPALPWATPQPSAPTVPWQVPAAPPTHLPGGVSLAANMSAPRVMTTSELFPVTEAMAVLGLSIAGVVLAAFFRFGRHAGVVPIRPLFLIGVAISALLLRVVVGDRAAYHLRYRDVSWYIKYRIGLFLLLPPMVRRGLASMIMGGLLGLSIAGTAGWVG